jgi:hypothetical protein
MTPNLLDDDAFHATFGSPMRDVTAEATDVIDIWPYVSAVPTSDLCGHTIYERFVERVYRTPDDRYDHVMVMTRTKNVYLVVVIDLVADSIYGHHLLDLNEEYGLV